MPPELRRYFHRGAPFRRTSMIHDIQKKRNRESISRSFSRRHTTSISREKYGNIFVRCCRTEVTAQKIRLFAFSAPFQREILRRNKVFSRRHTTSISREK